MPLGVGVQTSSAKGITALQLVIKLRTDFLLLPPPPTPLVPRLTSQIELRPIHTRGFAPGACARLILHVSVHTRERFQVRSICPGSLLPRMKYTHEIVGTHGGALLPKRAPGACSGSKILRVYRPFLKNTAAYYLCVIF